MTYSHHNAVLTSYRSKPDPCDARNRRSEPPPTHAQPTNEPKVAGAAEIPFRCQQPRPVVAVPFFRIR